MRTRSTTVSSVSWLVAAALTIAPFHGAMAAPAEAPAPDAAEAPTAEPEVSPEMTPEEMLAARDAQVETDITTAKNELAAAKAKIEGAPKTPNVEEALTEAETNLAAAKSAAAAAKGSVEEAKAELTAIKTDLEESKTALATRLASKPKMKAKDKADAEAAIAESEASVAKSEATIGTQESAIAEIEASITELETAIAAARGDAEAKARAEAEAKAKADAEKAAAQAIEDARPPEPRIANKPATGKGLMIAGGTVAGVGLGLTIAFSLMTRNCSIDGPLQCGLKNQDNFLIPMGAATLLTGTMLLGVGVGYYLRYKRWERWTPENGTGKRTAFVPTASRNGAGLAVVGRF